MMMMTLVIYIALLYVYGLIWFSLYPKEVGKQFKHNDFWKKKQSSSHVSDLVNLTILVNSYDMSTIYVLIHPA